jgi:uncharacterized protein (TIGR02145 family)
MKSRFITICILVCCMGIGLVGSMQSQKSITLTFTGRNAVTGVALTMDSIQVKGLTRSFDTTLIGVNTLTLTITTDVVDRILPTPESFVLSGNFGNPFIGSTSFLIALTSRTSLTLEVFDILGKKVADASMQADPGTHRFRFEGGGLEPGMYFLTARAGSQQRTVKMVKLLSAGGASVQLVHEGMSSAVAEGTAFQKAALADDFKFIGYAKGFAPETILATPLSDTKYDFRFYVSAPSITSFVADAYNKLLGDTVIYSLTMKDADNNLSKAWIDYNSDGVFDDSSAVSGGNAAITFKKLFLAEGSYMSKARVADAEGQTDQKGLTRPVVVITSKAPIITSFTADSYSKSVGDTVRYTVSVKDLEGNLSKIWIDFNGDGAFDDSSSVSGGNANAYFKKVFTTPGSYTAKVRAADVNGLMDEESLPNPVVANSFNTAPTIASFIADVYGVMTGDTVIYTVSAKDTDGNLAKVLIDFNRDLVFDDSASVSGGDALVNFKKVFMNTGTFNARARVIDSQGMTDEMNLSAPVIVVTANTAPTITSFVADTYNASIGDTVEYTISMTDAEGNLSKTWIDFNGNGVFDDSASVKGGSADKRFKTAFTATGSYLAKARVQDAKGLIVEKSLPKPVIVTPEMPRINKIDPDSIIIGAEMTITGAHFGPSQGSSSVFFKGGTGGNTFLISATDYVSWSASTIVLRVPAGILADGVVYLTIDSRTSNEFPFTLCTLFKVSGTIYGAGLDVSGVTVSDESRSAVTDSSGKYCIMSVPNGTHTITPAKAFYNFIPTSKQVYVMGANFVNVNFSMKRMACISGVISGACVDLSGITVSDGVRSALTDAKGVYSIKDVPYGSYTVTAIKAGVAITPTSKTVTVADVDVPNINFQATKILANDIIIDADCNEYHTIQIGRQLWTLENLKTTKYTDGTPIPLVTDNTAWKNLTTPGYCWYANNEAAYKDPYGALYNWYAVNSGKLTPAGWRVPTDADWNVLTSLFGSGMQNPAGGRLKEAGTVNWTPPNAGADNCSGFTALPGSSRGSNGVFDSLGRRANFWSSSEFNATTGYYRTLFYNYGSVWSNWGNKYYGCSVRFVKDGPTVNDIDGNVYHTITIGTQVWMMENLKTTKYNDGTPIPLVSDSSVWAALTTPGYCWYNNDAAANKATYGAMYNWYAVGTGKLAPTGWHVPTDDDWSTLTTYLGGESIAGGKLKESGKANWVDDNADNCVGFTALPGGYRTDNGMFLNQTSNGFWWTSTEYDWSAGWYRSMFYGDTKTVRDYLFFKVSGFSVRCVKD